ncbi:MAG TPA: histidinol-phosphatase HisJ [Bacilli bacterium]
MKWDGHTHTHFCKHGSAAHLRVYLDQAVALGFERYTVSEHPPLPAGWIADQALFAELAMKMDELPDYLACVAEAKKAYEGKLDVQIGLELDYLSGNESFTEHIVEKCGDMLEDAVVSVHFLPGEGGMRCVDFTADDFRDGLLRYYGTMDAVAEEYYNHVEKAIEQASAWPFRTRIGHINLIEKFLLALPGIDEGLIRRRLTGIIAKLKAAGVGVDVNVAGFRKDTCGKAYAPAWFIEACMAEGIACVYGSDAHQPHDVGRDWLWYAETTKKITKDNVNRDHAIRGQANISHGNGSTG